MTIYSVNNHRKCIEGGRMQRRVSSIQKKQRFPEHLRGQRGSSMGFFLAGVSVLLLVVTAGFLYIFQVTSSAVGGYDTTSLEDQIDDLKEESRQLELEAANLQSIKSIEQGVKQLNMVESERVAFTTPVVTGTVAYSGGQGEL